MRKVRDFMGNYQPLILTKGSVDPQEVKHIAEIREWLSGKKQSLRIIYNELANSNRELYFGDYHRDLDLAELPWQQDNVEPAVIEKIIDWALKQPPEVQDIIFQFLDAEDKREALETTLDQLELTTDTDKAPIEKHNSLSMAEIMRRALPATKDELIQLIQRVSVETKRPAATVRQFIRSETKKGNLYLENEVYYTKAGLAKSE